MDAPERVLFSLNVGYPNHPYVRRSFNVGTLRTLVLARRVSDELGVPLDIRLWHNPGGEVWSDCVSARVKDAMDCILWSGLKPRRIYELHTGNPTEAEIRRCVAPEIVDHAIEVLTRHPATVAAANPNLDLAWDDIFAQPGTLVVCGDEHVNFDSFCEWRLGDADHLPILTCEVRFAHRHQEMFRRMVHDAVGRPIMRHEVPVVKTADGHRMGPFNDGVVWWDAMEPIDADVVAGFLLATAANPDDPLSASVECPTDRISPHPYVWSWRDWYRWLSREVGEDAAPES